MHEWTINTWLVRPLRFQNWSNPYELIIIIIIIIVIVIIIYHRHHHHLAAYSVAQYTILLRLLSYEFGSIWKDLGMIWDTRILPLVKKTTKTQGCRCTGPVLERGPHVAWFGVAWFSVAWFSVAWWSVWWDYDGLLRGERGSLLTILCSFWYIIYFRMFLHNIGTNVNLSSDTISPLLFISHFLQNSTENFVLWLLLNLNFQLQTSYQADVFYANPHKFGLKKDAFMRRVGFSSRIFCKIQRKILFYGSYLTWISNFRRHIKQICFTSTRTSLVWRKTRLYWEWVPFRFSIPALEFVFSERRSYFLKYSVIPVI